MRPFGSNSLISVIAPSPSSLPLPLMMLVHHILASGIARCLGFDLFGYDASTVVIAEGAQMEGDVVAE